MSTERLNEYFATEARDYLDQLEGLLSAEGIPDSARLVRLASAVRGSMDMAGAAHVAQVAGRLEQAGRLLASADLSWSLGLQQVARQTVTDLRPLVGSLASWGIQQEEQVRMTISHWDGILPDQPSSGSIVSVESLYYDDEGPHIVFDGLPSPTEAVQVIPIQELLLRGEAALREAIQLKSAFEALVRGEGSDRLPDDLVDELFDLLDLSLTPEVQEV